jgi:two-component system, OmpR family, sensor kinase
MTLSIRARLTLWYSTVVVVILVIAAVAGWYAQARLALQRLDDDLARGMATLQGVMRTELGEGLGLEAAAAEASREVVDPGRTLVLGRADGSILQVWGGPLDRSALPAMPQGSGAGTVVMPGGEFRILRDTVADTGHRYAAAIVAPLRPFRKQQVEMVTAMSIGVAVALGAAAVGGWLIGRQTLQPLARMAEQARHINERHPGARLSAPAPGDELGQLAVSFNGLLDRLAAALNDQRQFMADASHELRTPVSVVRTAVQVTLARESRSVDEYRESLVIVGEQAARLSRLVDAMFLLSRAEAQGVPLRREFLNLDDLVAECARAVRVLASERQVTVTTSGAQEVGLTGDDGLLRQMIGNLLDNAIRHAPPGGRVEASLTTSSRIAVLRITNDGPAIAAADQQRIFERFVRLGASDGAGLGLPIAKWIAEAHDGNLRLEESRPGSTTFVVTLPAEAEIDRSSTG